MVRVRIGWAAMVVAAALIGCVDIASDGSWGEEQRSFVPASHGRLSESVAATELAVFVPLGVDRNRIAIAARDQLTIGEGARLLLGNTQLQPVVASMGRARIGQGAQLGSLYGEGSLTEIADGAQLRGYLEGCGAFQIGAARIDVGVLHRPNCELDEYRWASSFPSLNAGNRTSRALDSRPLDLAPGGYDAVELEPFSVLRLRTGTYYLNALVVQPNAVLELDNTLGPIKVWVRDQLQLSNGTVDYSLQPSIFFGYAGTRPPLVSAELRGTFVAPVAALELPNTERPHSGAFFAASVRLADGAVVEHRAFSSTPINQGPKSVCADCAAAARAMNLECCRRSNRVRSASASNQSLAAVACATDSVEPVACLAEQRARLSRRAEQDRSEFAGCLAAVSIAYGECQLREGYRPETCAKLPYDAYEPVLCGD